MGDSQVKNELLQQAYSIPIKSIKRIGLSYATFLQECGEFILWAQHDKDLLLTVGLNIITLSEAEILLEEARKIHAIWMNESKLTIDEIANWNQKKKEGVDLGRQLIRHFKFAFRHDKNLLALTGKIKFPGKISELSSNMNLLIHRGKAHADLLDAIGFDFSILARAEQVAKELPELHAHKSAASTTSHDKIKRDQIFYLLKLKVDEIRALGRYVFRNNSERLKGYRSAYIKQKNDRVARSKKKDE